MNPFKRSINILILIILLIGFGAGPVFFSAPYKPELFITAFFSLVFNTLTFFFYFSFATNSLYLNNKVRQFWVLGTAYFLLVLFISIWLFTYLNNRFQIGFFPDYPLKFVAPFLMTSIWAASGIYLRLLISWRRIDFISTDLEYRNTVRNINLLRYKLNPNLISKVLRFIKGNEIHDVAATSSLLDNLSLLLRYSMGGTVNEMVTLKKELEELTRYWKTVSLVYSPGIDLNLTININNNTRHIPILSLIGIVEEMIVLINNHNIHTSIRYHIFEKTTGISCKINIDIGNGFQVIDWNNALSASCTRLQNMFNNNFNISREINESSAAFEIIIPYHDN